MEYEFVRSCNTVHQPPCWNRTIFNENMSNERILPLMSFDTSNPFLIKLIFRSNFLCKRTKFILHWRRNFLRTFFWWNSWWHVATLIRIGWTTFRGSKQRDKLNQCSIIIEQEIKNEIIITFSTSPTKCRKSTNTFVRTSVWSYFSAGFCDILQGVFSGEWFEKINGWSSKSTSNIRAE